MTDVVGTGTDLLMGTVVIGGQAQSFNFSLHTVQSWHAMHLGSMPPHLVHIVVNFAIVFALLSKSR